MMRRRYPRLGQSGSSPVEIPLLIRDKPALILQYEALTEVLESKFGEDSDIYRSGVTVFLANVRQGGVRAGIPTGYKKVLAAISNRQCTFITLQLKENVDAIKNCGLEPRDPAPRPWAGMKVDFMGDPTDPLFKPSEEAVMEHVRQKGKEPVLLHIRTKNKLYKSVEPGADISGYFN